MKLFTLAPFKNKLSLNAIQFALLIGNKGRYGTANWNHK